MMKWNKWPICLFWLIFIQCSEPEKIDLSGTWQYKLDESNKGIEERWYMKTFDKTIELPASLRDHHVGNTPSINTLWTGGIYDSSWFFSPAMDKYRKPGNLKFPFWLTPVKRYVGIAWYQKQIIIPETWNQKELSLILERPHWQTQVWFDSVWLGSQNSLSTPHRYEINPDLVAPGRHTLTIRNDNAIRDVDPGINSHSITDHTQGNWNGITGEISLCTNEKVYIKTIRLKPDVTENRVDVSVRLNNNLLSQNVNIKINIEGLNHDHRVESVLLHKEDTSTMVHQSVYMGDEFKTWSEFTPDLYELTVILEDENGKLDEVKQIFGMREFAVNNNRFEINGIPVFLRGTTECCVFPLSGYPPTDEASWERIFQKCRSFGLNHMRFHSYCPPEAAFIAADKAGIYLQIEGPSWAKYSVTLGDGLPVDQYLMEETKRIIDVYGNHPSFCLMAYGNEPSGNYVPYLENWVEHFRNYDPQRVFTGASTGRSWAIIENSDFIVRSPPRGLEWRIRQPESIFDYRHKTEGQEKPYITFEMGQWCVFPNFKEIEKYTGPLKARNFELFREDLKDKHMGDQAIDFLMASGKLQTSCYKQEIEAALRTSNLAGFQLLSLNDFPGQGTALVGVLDAFWDEKGYTSAREFQSFCNEVVPLIRLPKYTFYNNETLKAGIEVVNFSGTELNNSVLHWFLEMSDGLVVDSGSVYKKIIPVGNCIYMGDIETELNYIDNATKLTLKIAVNQYTNQWNIWVYPDNTGILDSTGIYICKQLDEEAVSKLREGNKVLLLAAGQVQNGKDVIQYYEPVFWNTSWFRMRPPHTTGMLIQNNHAVFSEFPTDYYSDLQWWDLSNKQQVMNLEYFPEEFRPLVQPVDTWFLNRRLAMLFEAKADKGKLMVCSMDICNIENRPVAGQLKRSILNYMQSDSFNPEAEIEMATIRELFEEKERKGWKSYVNANP